MSWYWGILTGFGRLTATTFIFLTPVIPRQGSSWIHHAALPPCPHRKFPIAMMDMPRKNLCMLAQPYQAFAPGRARTPKAKPFLPRVRRS